MLKHARYICLEGTEGTGKTTQTQLLTDHLRNKGFKVLQTKEPGTPALPLTMLQRGIMLDNKWEEEITDLSREFISQSIRSIHLEKLVYPGDEEYDFIVQDRGIFTGYAYANACGFSFDLLRVLAQAVVGKNQTPNGLYSDIVYLTGDTEKGLKRALSSKQEFETGDAMESRGNSFLRRVADNMDMMVRDSWFDNIVTVPMEGKDIDGVFQDILVALKL